jgi:hypothetical protein
MAALAALTSSAVRISASATAADTAASTACQHHPTHSQTLRTRQRTCGALVADQFPTLGGPGVPHQPQVLAEDYKLIYIYTFFA